MLNLIDELKTLLRKLLIMDVKLAIPFSFVILLLILLHVYYIILNYRNQCVLILQHAPIAKSKRPSQNNQSGQLTSTVSKKIVDGKVRILVVYAYHEVSWRVPNLNFFVDMAVLPPHPGDRYWIHYVFVINGFNLSVDIPSYSNIDIIKREYIGLDVCAWKIGLDYALNEKNGFYNYFILMDSSIRGPFLPNYISFSEWPLPFLSLLTDHVKLVGTTCACGVHPIHIQSMFLLTNQIGMDLIKHTFECGYSDKLLVTRGGELVWAGELIKNGYNIACLSIWWRDWDFRNTKETDKRCEEWNSFGPAGGDNYLPGQYDGGDYYPLELIFFKTNRKIRDADVAHLTKIYYKQALALEKY